MDRKHASAGATCLVAAVAAAVIFVMAGPARSAEGPQNHDAAVIVPAGQDRRLIEVAVTEALVIHQQAYSSATPDSRPASAVHAPTTGPVLRSLLASTQGRGTDSAATRQLRWEARNKNIDRRFTASAADHEHQVLAAVRSADQDPHFRSLDGGISSVVLSSVTIAGSHAEARGRTTAWSSMAQRQPDGKWLIQTAENSLELQVRLDFADVGGWRVSTFTWQFAPGTEP